MLLENLKNNRKFINIGLVIVSVILVYFVGFNLSHDFASSEVIEYKSSVENLDGIAAKVNEKSNPKEIQRSSEGTIRFYFQNISAEKVEEINNEIAANFQVEATKNYETIPAQDSNIVYRYINLSLFAFFGLLFFTVLLFRLGLSIVHLVKIFFAMILSGLFELIVSLGILSLLGLIGVQINYNIVLAFLSLVFLSLLIKFISFKWVHEKINQGVVDLAQSWRQAIEKHRSLFIYLYVLIIIISAGSIVLLPQSRAVVIMIIVNTFIVAYSSAFLTGDLLDLKVVKNNANNKSKQRKSK